MLAQLVECPLAKVDMGAQVAGAESLWVLSLDHATGNSIDDDLLVAHV
jgi:hypothetical protein